MELTEKQKLGLEIALTRFKKGEPYTIIGGYAGTGKTFLINYIIEKIKEEYKIKETEIAYASYTGKAASVMRQQGKDAITLHKLLYEARPNGQGGFYFIKRKNLGELYKLIVIDEISMCPIDMWELLLSHNVYIIALGDPFQLPPIKVSDDNHLLDNPHIFLTEVMRQALDNDIIKYSMKIRQGEKITAGIQGEHFRTFSKNQFSTGMMKWADQILCGRNQTRKEINAKMREILGFEELIENGDKMICVKNYWDNLSTDYEPLVNGFIGTVFNNKICSFTTSDSLSLKNGSTIFEKVRPDIKLLRDGISSADEYWAMCKRDYRYRRRNHEPHYHELDYGYAITVHKAQGSQFGKVLIYDEIMGDELYHQRWLYTAITRATNDVVVVV